MSEEIPLERIGIKVTHQGWVSFCPVWYSDDLEWLGRFGHSEHYSAIPIAKYHLDILLMLAIDWQMFCQSIYIAVINLRTILGMIDPLDMESYNETGFVAVTSKLKEPITIYRYVEDLNDMGGLA